MSSKKPATKKASAKAAKKKTKADSNSAKKKKEESKKETIKDTQDEGKRRSLISALKRGISIKGDSPSISSKDPMNIVITLSPAKHADIIEYIEETVPPGGRAEWVRDSIRLKMRIERGVYGLNTSGQDETQKGTEETLQTVFGQFAEVMTKVMADLKTDQTSSRPIRAATSEVDRSRPPAREREDRAGPPQLKKVEVEDDKKLEELKPDRPSLDDAIGAIVVVE